MTKSTRGETNQKQDVFNLAIAAMVAQVGCLTLVIIFAALFLGLYLDNRFGSNHWFTFGFMIASIPVSLIVMVFVSRAAVRKIKTPAAAQEEQDVGSQE
jgi:MFS-type transporter involved in bile tolerance (Atg22 family)